MGTTSSHNRVTLSYIFVCVSRIMLSCGLKEQCSVGSIYLTFLACLDSFACAIRCHVLQKSSEKCSRNPFLCVKEFRRGILTGLSRTSEANRSLEASITGWNEHLPMFFHLNRFFRIPVVENKIITSYRKILSVTARNLGIVSPGQP